MKIEFVDQIDPRTGEVKEVRCEVRVAPDFETENAMGAVYIKPRRRISGVEFSLNREGLIQLGRALAELDFHAETRHGVVDGLEGEIVIGALGNSSFIPDGKPWVFRLKQFKNGRWTRCAHPIMRKLALETRRLANAFGDSGQAVPKHVFVALLYRGKDVIVKTSLHKRAAAKLIATGREWQAEYIRQQQPE